MKTIAFIPARGGSKSIPKKNIKLFCGKPLIYWNLKALDETCQIDEIYVGTDSDEIASVVHSFNFKKVNVYDRDPKNADDISSTESVMLEFIQSVEMANDTLFILVQTTCPFIESIHISDAIQLYKSLKVDSLLSCARIKNFLWSKEGKPLNYDYNKRPRRQEFAGALMENGAFYINTVKNIITKQNRLSGNIAVYEMPEYSAIDIDEPYEWSLAEEIMKQNILKKNYLL